MKTITKDELYTFDELVLIKQSLEKENQKSGNFADELKILGLLMEGTGNNPEKTAVFFMPLQTFNIFAMIQGDNSLCSIKTENLEKIFSVFQKNEKQLLNATEDEKSLICKKLKVLLEFLRSGNEVKPVITPVDI